MNGRSPRGTAGAFTLIEVLLALAVTVLVVLLVFSIYRTVAEVSSGQRLRARTSHAALDTLEALGRDLVSLFAQEGDEACAVRLAPAANGPDGETAELSFCAFLPPADGDLRWSEARRITWRVDEEDGGRVLRRLAQPHRGSPVTNVSEVMAGITWFRVEFFDGESWVAAWPPGDEPAMPRAARAALAGGVPGTGNLVSTEFWIPAGTVVTSRMVRGRAGP